MTIFNLWLFDEKGNLIYYREWNRKKNTSMERNEEAKLLYGMLFSIKSFVNKLSPADMKDGFLSYKTSKYRLNYYETPTGVKLVMNTDTTVTHPIVRDLLKSVYGQIYVEYAVKNPMYVLGQPIESELFGVKLDDLVRASPLFKA
ncbi:hypothetical protein TCAL_04024 [Tigriopus californicus]|uniref:Trafficking protein particle complex subunit n=1 Tax=Tigriopus californicus TaxID=6832 RepID=A0A553NG55_TIGCA|nr:trafficking protein particle complex subunit 1-like [Tigriopus californicus]TRY64385.1 hypothetical protein TCAL_04024 [Tigriopus californicus]|eukprot:TCALIF_04024-PA protein Name:"Similar to Trappc1 Trafficking protein particle complex subunit 1 (Rattus norvegicus)" AED:0.00 eAED:0.00 QI:145/1/1/1/1/1/2/1197/144